MEDVPSRVPVGSSSNGSDNNPDTLLSSLRHDDDDDDDGKKKGVRDGVPAAMMPWPMPPARSQYIFCVTAMWMLFPVILTSAPDFFLWQRNAVPENGNGNGNGNVVSFSLCFWLLSVVVSVVHWGRYVPRGTVQILDVTAAVGAGIASAVEAFWYVDEQNSSEYGVIIGLLVVIATLGYCESAKPHWDQMNGFVFHNLLRYAAIWLFAIAAGRPSSSSSRSAGGAGCWLTFFLTAGVYGVDVCLEVHLVNRSEKGEYAYSARGNGDNKSRLQPTFVFKALGLVRTFVVVLLTAFVNARIWAFLGS